MTSATISGEKKVHAKSRDELLREIERMGEVRGSHRAYTAAELKRYIDRAFEMYDGTTPSRESLERNPIINRITRANGIRENVMELLQKNEEQHPAAKRGRLGGMVDKVALNYNIRRADKYERLAEESGDGAPRAKYYSRAAKWREKAASLLEGTDSTSRSPTNMDHDHQIRMALDDYIKGATYWEKQAAGPSASRSATLKAWSNYVSMADAARRIAQKLGKDEVSSTDAMLPKRYG